MKKNFLLLTILILSALSKNTAQECLPEGIKFIIQEQIDNFSINHQGCIQIIGDVVIKENIPGTITNLDRLSQITSIVGYLKVWRNGSLKSLNGLKNLTSIGVYLEVYLNPSLTNLKGLENLTPKGEKIKRKVRKKKNHITWVTSLGKSSNFKGYLRGVGDSVIVLSNHLNKLESNYRIQNIDIRTVKTIKFRKKEKIGKSILYGALTGFAIGALSAVIDGDDVPGKDCYDPTTPTPGLLGGLFGAINEVADPCFTVGDKVRVRGVPLGITGALIGGIVGSIKIKIPINGNHRTLRA